MGSYKKYLKKHFNMSLINLNINEREMCLIHKKNKCNYQDQDLFIHLISTSVISFRLSEKYLNN